MRFQVTTAAVTNQRTGCLILPVYQEGELPAVTRAVDRVAGGAIADVVQSRDIAGKAGDTLLLAAPAGLGFRRILLVGCGGRGKLDRDAYRKVLRAAWQALARTRQEEAACFLTGEAVRGADPYRRARIAAETWHDNAYRFTAMKSSSDEEPPAQKRIALAFRSTQAAAARRGIAHADAIGLGMDLARDLGNLPANVCTPAYLVDQARKLARGDKRLEVDVLEEADMRKLKMGSLLSVTAGAAEPAKFIVLRYRNAAASRKPVVLVGKGITFDSGGISIKPAPQMDEMKYDMSGAGAVLGVMRAVTELGLGINLVGIVPACENMPSGTATRPGDIVTSMSGQTIEILNTDAEGRLILCDALTYAARFEPAAIVDIATLTGACLIALGRHRSGLLSNTERLASALLRAGERADDPAWQLPLGDPYMDQLKSNFADVANVGGREAGTITAACFLSRFVKDVPWAHLDIAGTAWRQGARKGSTGRPVPLLMEYLLDA